MNPVLFTDEQMYLIKLILSERIDSINEHMSDSTYSDDELPDIEKEKNDLQEIVNILK